MAKPDLTSEQTNPIRAILWLAWPALVEQILSTLVSFADTAMVGALGITATASVSISNSFVFLLNSVVLALGTGLTTYIARSVGAKDYEGARAYIRHALILLAMVGIPIVVFTCIMHRLIPLFMGAGPDIIDSAASYLLITSAFRIFIMAMMVLGSVFRGRGDTKTPLWVGILVNIVNIVGNYLLINPTHWVELFGRQYLIPGAGWGVNGAALSTGISWVLGGSILALLLFTKKDPTRISLKESFKPDFGLIRRVVSLSLPAMLERASMSGSSVVVTRSIALLGTVAVGANTISLTAESFSYMPAFAFQMAITTLVGQSLGAGKPDLARRYVKHTVQIGVIAMLLAGAGLFCFADTLVGVITQDAAAAPLAARCIRIVALIQPPQAVAWIYGGALRGAGDTRSPFYITAACNWGVRALGAILLVRVLRLELPFVIWCANAEICLRCFLMSRRFGQGKWEHTIRG